VNFARLPRLRPTAAFGGLVFVLFAMWYAASSQNNAAAYLLFFTLGSLFVVSIPHALFNVANLTATTESVKPTFAGDEVSLPVEVTNQSAKRRYGVRLQVPASGGEEQAVDEIAAGRAARVMIRFPARARGEYEVKHLCLASAFPLGFLRAIKQINCRQRFLVYPKPEGDPRLPRDRAHSARSRPRMELGEGDDFAGVRAYEPGQSQRQIDWKAVARGHPLLTKQYSSEAAGVLYLDFATAPGGDPEARLAQLALWIIQAERARRPYGLRLRGTEIAPSLGQAHFHRCLRALALFK
jgi:uncharacterized protein (DUF58 family)